MEAFMFEELVKTEDGRLVWRRVLPNGQFEDREAKPEEIDEKEFELEE
jgi:hypothetical protein